MNEIIANVLSDVLGIYENVKKVQIHTTGGVMLAPNTVAMIGKSVSDVKALVDKLQKHTSSPVSGAPIPVSGGKKMSWEK